MKNAGLLAIKIPVNEYDYHIKWLSNVLGYNRLLSEFFYENEISTEKLTFIASATGGLPIILSQKLYGRGNTYHQPSLSDLGVLAFKVRTKDIKRQYLKLKAAQEPFLEKFAYTYYNKPCFWLTDSEANFFQVVEEQAQEGVYGIIISVDNIDKARSFFSNFGFTEEIHKSIGYFSDLEPLGFSPNKKAKRLILRHKTRHPLSNFMGITEIDLVQMLDSQRRNVFTKYSVYFAATHVYKRPDNFSPQFKVIDNDFMQAIFSQVDYPLASVHLVELRTLRFKDVWELDLTRNNYSPVPIFRLKTLLNNIAENLD